MLLCFLQLREIPAWRVGPREQSVNYRNIGFESILSLDKSFIQSLPSHGDLLVADERDGQDKERRQHALDAMEASAYPREASTYNEIIKIVRLKVNDYKILQ